MQLIPQIIIFKCYCCKTIILRFIPLRTVLFNVHAGCPFTFKKYTGSSHPFGKNVTYGTINNTPEKCKHWCLVRAYCRGVDFAVSTGTCYFLREINSALLVEAPTVNHYEKTNCAREFSAVRPERTYVLLAFIFFRREISELGRSIAATFCTVFVCSIL